MGSDDARSLDRKTVEAPRIGAVRSVQAGENPRLSRALWVLPYGQCMAGWRAAGECLQPARISKDVAIRIRSEIGHATFEAQYQQHPLPAGAGSFDLSLLMRYKNFPKGFEYIFFSIDVATIANGGDYSVCTIWGYVEQNFYLLGLWRKQVSSPQLRKAIIELDCASFCTAGINGSNADLFAYNIDLRTY